MAGPTTIQRKAFAKVGIAMPDGSYFIRNAADLKNAIDSVGRGDASHDAIRKHCIARAKALHLSNMIPADWNPDGSLKHMDVDEFIAHFGVKGMHWGVKRTRGEASSDHASASALLAKAHKGGGIHTLSNDELKTLNDRLNLESNHRRLTGGKDSPQELVKGLLVNEAKKEAGKLAAEFAAKGAEFLAKEATKQLLGTRAGAGRHTK